MLSDLERVLAACQELYNIPAAAGVRNYADSRVSRQIQDKFGFGYFPNQNNFEVMLPLVDEAALHRSKLRFDKVENEGIYRKTIRSTYEHHNLVMPYKDVYGEIVSMVGRTILSSEEADKLGIPKYRNTSFEKNTHLFGLYESKKSIIENNCAVVVEGQFDCISAHDNGIENVVALGCSSMTMYQLGLLMRYTDNIYLLLDNDEPGIKGAERILDKLGSYCDMKSKTIPIGYKDLDDFIKDNRSAKLYDLINL